MKLKTIFLFLMAVIVLAPSCKDDDDGQNGNGDSFTATCCQIPHLEACVGGAKVFVPNAFTPNGDGSNDLFRPWFNGGVKEIPSFSVVNENGVVIFKETNIIPGTFGGFGWDGSLADGTFAASGIYTYTISITNIANETQEFEGSVCCRAGDTQPCVDFEKHCVYGTQHDGDGGFYPDFPSFENCE